jgi:hypothetical protein
MAFKQFFFEKFDFKKTSLPFSVDWKQISPNIWRTSFAYDDATGSVSADLKKKNDTYDVNAEYIKDPYGMESALADVAHEYVNHIKQEPYWWIDFESRAFGTETSSKEGAAARNARLILKTVIGILAEKIQAGDNISFTSGADQQSKISLYTLLANLLAKEYGKKVNVLPHEEEVYFFVH